MTSLKFRLWDLPTRLFHWLLVVAVLASLITGQIGGGLMDWHGRIGLVIVGLIAFRFVWGVLGSTYARFSQFFPTLTKLKAYRLGTWHGVGHNPFGALSVFALLGVLTVQLVTGLFSNDDITFVGPLFDLVSKTLSNRLTGIHHFVSNVLIALVLLHVGAIGYYGHVKKEKLIKPMLAGWHEGDGQSAKGGGFIVFLIALVIASAVVYGASGVWLPEPPVVPTAETPGW